MKRFVLFAVLLASCAIRPAAAQTRRSVERLQLWPEAQAELALPGNDYLLLALRGQNNTANNDLQAPNRFLGFDERRVTLGYEHFWNEHWSVGGTLAYASYSSTYLLLPEVLLRHRSSVGPLTFGQRLSFERTFPGQASAQGQTNARLRVDLEKILTVGTVALRPRLSYEAATHARILKSDTDPDERTIQFTSLRGEVGCRLGPRFDFTPWFAYQTSYLITLPQFDALGKQTSGGKLNAVYPVVGLDLRFTLLQGRDADTRQQLPTQH